jgi:hypothetical protein
MSRYLFQLAGLVVLACLGPAGCGGGSREVPISGDVTLDGVPLPEGSIHFSPADGSTTTQAVLIKDGKFQTRLQGTTYRVEISAARLAKKGPRKVVSAGPGEDDLPLEALIPPRYNLRSELKLTVKEARSDVRYDLKSK